MVMHTRVATGVFFVTSCLLALNPAIHAQSADVLSEGICPPSADKQPSAPEITIAQLSFSGVVQMATTDQDQIAASVKQQTYGDSLDGATDEAIERVKAGWQDHGYFKAAVTGDAKILSSSPISQRIALSVHVEEGLQYSLGGIIFEHKTIGTVESLRGLFPIKDGEVFSREMIATGLENLRKAYGNLGYINFTSVPNTKFDDENKLVFLDIDLDESKRFYLNGVTILDVDEPARRELLDDFPLKRGQPFSQRLVEIFIRNHAARLPGGYDQAIDEKAGIVTLTFFSPCPVN
jgi:outer membrane protein assembly factor BamA